MTTLSPQPRRPRSARSLTTSLILAAVVVSYALLQPKLENWLGDEPPGPTDEPTVQSAESPNELTGEPSSVGHDRPDVPSARQSERDASSDTPTSRADSGTAAATPKLGELRDIGGKVFQSTAGLYYRPGSQEGHRIRHILRHHQDNPDRPVHGVFDGDRNEVFAVIDEAYLYTFDHGPPRVSTEQDDGRTIYRVDLGRRIGYVGGQSGRRQRHPAARHVQLILEGTNVITAYPVRVGQQRD
jgi:hypothetical protein